MADLKYGKGISEVIYLPQYPMTKLYTI